MDLDALLDGARLPQKVMSVCLRGDLLAEHEALDAELLDLPTEATSMGGHPRIREIRDRMAELTEQMRAATVKVTLRAMNRRAWQRLCEQHPPRLDADGLPIPADRGSALQVNRATFFEPMLRACVVDPAFSDDQWTRFVDVLSDGQFERLASAAALLCMGDVDIPLSPPVSPQTGTSATG